MDRRRWQLAFVVGGLLLAGAAVARADSAPGPDEVEPHHGADATCTVEGQESDEVECAACEVEHTLYEADYESCERLYSPWGFALACGDLWTEVYCRERDGGGWPDVDAGGDGQEDGGPEATADEGCGAAGRVLGTEPLQVGLATVTLLVGLLVLRRSRR